MVKPNFFIIGLPRCGTTSLSYYLRCHPEVFLPAPLYKEPHFFSSDVYQQQTKSEAEYLELFQEASHVKLIGEASVFYIFSDLARKDILAFNPNAKIIIMIRHPIDFMISLHRMLVETGKEPIQEFSKALDVESERAVGNLLPPKTNYSLPFLYKTVGAYSRYVEKYIDTFGKQQVKIVFLEDFSKDTPTIYREILQFLEIDTSHSPKFTNYNSSNTLWAKKFVSNNRGLRRIVPMIPSSFRHQIAGLLGKAKTSNNEIDLSLRRRLNQEFEQEIDRIAAISQRSLQHWKT